MAGESEAVTSRMRIDRALKTAGWPRIVPFMAGTDLGTAAVEEFPTQAGPADNVLYHEGRPLAVVEGKLVPQDPSDEPASVLLGRIKAERGKGKQAKLT